MKKLGLVVCGLMVVSACGGGGGGGGGTYTPPALVVVISPSTQTTIDAGQTVKFTATVQNDSSGKGVTWSVSAAGVTGAAGGTISSATTTSATYNAPAAVAANLNVTVTATAVAGSSTTSAAAVVVAPTPCITPATLTDATPNANYSATLQAAGGVGTLTWSLVSGALPTGLSLSGSGAITGVPTVSGTSTFTAQVADSSPASSGGPATVQGQFTLTVVTVVILVTSALPSGSAGVAYLAGIGATGGTPPYTWSVKSGNLPAGLTMQSGSGVISGTPTAQGNSNFTVSAQDSSPTNQSQSGSLMLVVGAPGPLAITTVALPDGAVSSPYTAALAATGGTPPYTWGLTAGALAAGISLNATTGAFSGTPLSAGAAGFIVRVTDASPVPQTQTQALSLTVGGPAQTCASAGNNGVLSGPYAFSLSGFNDMGFLTVVGSFTADGTGKITAGEADTNGVLGAQHGSIITSASSYSVGTDNRGCATLATPFGAFNTHFSLGSVTSNVAGSGRVVEWDNPSASAFVGSGQLLRQSSSSFSGGLTGSYIFHTVGWDPSPSGRDVCVGVLIASGNTFYDLDQDCNDTMTITNLIAPDAAGTYTALDANGRGTAVITLGGTNSDLAFYAISGSQALAVNADAGPWASGEWDQQTLPAGGSGFTQASLNGNMVFYLNGVSLDATASAASMETASADGTSTLTIMFYEDRAGTMQVSSTLTCTYSVAPNGRITLSSNTYGCGGTPPVFYLTAANRGYIVDVSPGVDTGIFEPQSAGPFSNATLSGSFFGGTAEVALQSVQPEVDAVSPNGSGGITGATDLTSTSAQDAKLTFLPTTYTVNADGTFSVNTSAGAVAGVIVSNSKFVMFSPSTSATSYPTLLVMQK